MMTPMRRAEREIADFEQQLELLARCKVCRLGLRDEEGPYILPLNFGFARQNDGLVLYFHSAKAGRKLRAIAADPLVAFELDTDHQLREAKEPCGFGYAYACLTGTGRDFCFTPQQADAVAVIRLRVERMTGNVCR